ncbi:MULTISPECIES: DUF4390 domain-containing protein [Thiomicrorhabdus]|uniref:DUF4390 domain-containing protein n=1 Tax=Thiomicrorhabdus heinhorstiae TaxID=2748010 RepID=A0ABS0BZK3_9GAMM|nr:MULTISPECIES: DUF4390 domain-containing protein [Thiomicrorhabdus]MBF6057527.1 DUF4390 domain-containing protein [Thiomicrorhabdus heinhorstiae]
MEQSARSFCFWSTFGKNLRAGLGIFLLLCLSCAGWASDEILIVRVSDYQNQRELLIDSESKFHLPEKVTAAIHHEIPLLFTTTIVLTESASFLGIKYQRTRRTIEYQTQLYAYGVNHHYVLYNTRNQNVQSFPTLDAALETLGTLQSFPIATLSELHPQQRYTIKMRIKLDYWKLPAPLIIDAMMDSDWRINSGWFETFLKTPQSWQ